MSKLRRFLLNKLIRDHCLNPDNTLRFLEPNMKATLKILNHQEAIQAFKLKLQEEVDEVVQTPTVDTIKEELADILEVIHGFAHAIHSSFDDIEAIRKHKKEVRGGFEKQLFVIYVDLPKDHPYIAYNLAQPDKTPEIPYIDE